MRKGGVEIVLWLVPPSFTQRMKNFLSYCLSFWTLKKVKLNPELWMAFPLFLYSPQHQHPACTSAPSLQNVDRLSVGFTCTHRVNLNSTSHKVTLKLRANGAKSPITAWLIYCYSASLPRTDLCLLHCLSLTWLTQIPENPTHMHTHSGFFAFIDFIFSNIFFHHSTGKLG